MHHGQNRRIKNNVSKKRKLYKSREKFRNLERIGGYAICFIDLGMNASGVWTDVQCDLRVMSSFSRL